MSKATHLDSQVKCFFDGCCEPINPGGHIGYGGYIIQNDRKIYEFSEYRKAQPVNSNQVAEYLAFEKVIDFLIINEVHKTDQCISIYGDSKLVIMQMNNNWKIRTGIYTSNAYRCHEKMKNFDRNKLFIQWIHGATENTYADKLSRKPLIDKAIPFRKDLKERFR